MLSTHGPGLGQSNHNDNKSINCANGWDNASNYLPELLNS